MTPKKLTAKILILLTLAFYLTTCSMFARRPYSPLGIVYTKPLSLDQITDEIVSRTHSLDTLWARMKVTIRDPEVRGKKYFLATLLYRNPDQIRLRGSRAITSTIFEILLRTNELQVYLNRDRQLFVGTLDDLRQRRDILSGIDPLVFVRLVQADSILSRALSSSAVLDSGQSKHHYVFSIEADNTKQVFAVRKSDLLIQQLGIYDRKGHLQVRISYDRYISVGETLMPAEIKVIFQQSGATMQLIASEYKLNPPLSEQVFSTLGEPGAQKHPLTDLVEKQYL